MALCPALASAASVFVSIPSTWIWILDGALVVLVVSDAFTLPRKKALRLKRVGSSRLSVGARNRVTLQLACAVDRSVFVRLTESYPETMEVSELPTQGWLRPRLQNSFSYYVVPRQRGTHSVGRTFIRALSRGGLWERQYTFHIPYDLNVLPNVRAVSTYALLARRNRIDLMGFRRARGRGSDVEFDRLRDYQTDDDHRRIDPFASARYQRLITREYQVSRNQNVFFMIDCGRSMGGVSCGLSDLDYALDATLMLSHVAIEQGDNVGLMAFDTQVRKTLLPRRGPRRQSEIVHALYDLRTSRLESDYERAFSHLRLRVRQRSLIVLITNVMDQSTYELIAPHVRALQRYHLPLVLLMRDRELFGKADRPPATVTDFYQVAAAAEIATWRERLSLQLQQLGGIVLDTIPDRATSSLINRYLKVKAEKLL